MRALRGGRSDGPHKATSTYSHLLKHRVLLSALSIIVGVVGLATPTSGESKGPPVEVCRYMNLSHSVSEAKHPAPYDITLKWENAVVKVTIYSKDKTKDKFTGFLMKMVLIGSDKPYGEWIPDKNKIYQTLKCFKCNDFVNHTKNDTKTSVSFTWKTTTAGSLRKIQAIATIAKNEVEWWKNVKSNTVEVPASRPLPLINNLINYFIDDLLPCYLVCIQKNIRYIPGLIQDITGNQPGNSNATRKFPPINLECYKKAIAKISPVKMSTPCEVLKFLSDSNKWCSVVSDISKCIEKDLALLCGNDLAKNTSILIRNVSNLLDCNVEKPDSSSKNVQGKLRAIHYLATPFCPPNNMTTFLEKVVTCAATSLGNIEKSPNPNQLCGSADNLKACIYNGYEEYWANENRCFPDALKRQLNSVYKLVFCNVTGAMACLELAGTKYLNETCKVEQQQLEVAIKSVDIQDAFSVIARNTCLPVNKLNSCIISFLKDVTPYCKNWVTPTIERVLAPSIYHFNSSSGNVCPVNKKAIGNCKCVDRKDITKDGTCIIKPPPEPKVPVIKDTIDKFLEGLLPCHLLCVQKNILYFAQQFEYIVNLTTLEPQTNVIIPTNSSAYCYQKAISSLNGKNVCDILGSNDDTACEFISLISRCIGTDVDSRCGKDLAQRTITFIKDTSKDFLNCYNRPRRQPSPNNAAKSKQGVIHCLAGPFCKSKDQKTLTEKLDECATVKLKTTSKPVKECSYAEMLTLCMDEEYKKYWANNVYCSSTGISQLKSIHNFVNCKGTGSLPCLLHAIQSGTKLSTKCKLKEAYTDLAGGIKSAKQVDTGKFALFASKTCSSLNNLTSCIMLFLNDFKPCRNWVIPTIRRILAPSIYHLNNNSNSECPVNNNASGGCKCPEQQVTIPNTCPKLNKTTAFGSGDGSGEGSGEGRGSVVAIRVKFKLQQTFTIALSDPSSKETRELKVTIKTWLVLLMTTKYGSLFFAVVNIRFSKGSINVDFDLEMAADMGISPSQYASGISGAVTGSLATQSLVSGNGTTYTVEPGSVQAFTPPNVRTTSPPDTTTPAPSVTYGPSIQPRRSAVLNTMLIVSFILAGLIAIAFVVMGMRYCYCGGCNPFYLHSADDVKKGSSDAVYGAKMIAVRQAWPSLQMGFPPPVTQISQSAVYSSIASPVAGKFALNKTELPPTYVIGPGKRVNIAI